MVNTDEFIKAHLTRDQRDLLQVLVNQRIHDLQRDTWGNRRPLPGELDQLRLVKYELAQAGS